LTGLDHNVELLPALNGPSKLPKNTLPLGLPPVLPDQREQLEEYLIHPEKLPVHDYKRAQRFIPREPRLDSLFTIGVCNLTTNIVVERDPSSGKLRGYKEDFLPDVGATPKNSTSLRRPPGPPDQGVKGSSTNYPFWPGGLEEPNIELLNQEEEGVEGVEIDFEHDLLTVPPGFERGIEFETKTIKSVLSTEPKQVSVLNLADIFSHDEELLFGEEETLVKDEEEKTRTEIPVNETAMLLEDVDDIIKIGHLDSGLIKAKELEEKNQGYEFAFRVDVNTPVDDFYKRIPDMAYQWPFELDVFQKQAILHLENHENVFVAAHTSAGKTVVAEYAIALAMKHMTRTIYTSPIKALSNQKFRDFKTTFTDVGLITGDVQIAPEAACLIMTTEILRSMLYKGSDVIRDLEWVIFDEVHYINDSERGVVWEEVLIMLPSHVNIILLSATVPNTMEFADWVGRTKRKRVYVVSTTKRPIPLEHYLYTGNSSKTSTELFKIIDSNKNFVIGGYNKALDAKKERTTKFKQGFGARERRGGDPRQEKNVWLSVIEMLRKKERLPVVCFTFSRKRIDENASHMTSVDLTTENEKGRIHMFVQRCMSRLKGGDRKLPQVKTMSDMLKRGIGVHHSGILPILKEVVEMLFCQGFVKVLFATETFAMGVNMPARTVVFDSIRKHDGKEFRNLLPGEYIQMAGRAGRRGLDTTGTVIILAKGDVPPINELQMMMMGVPTKLESQFRLTYSMILNLLRVAQLRVEDMMKRSFAESTNQRDTAKRKQMLDEVSRRMADMPEVVDYSGDLEEYYNVCHEYHIIKEKMQDLLQSHPQAVKSMSPGRLIIVDMHKHRHTLALVLKSASTSRREKLYPALVITDDDANWLNYVQENDSKDSDWSLPRPVLPNRRLFVPQGKCGHELIDVSMKDIAIVTTEQLKLDTEAILENCKRRQIARFRDDPPGQSVVMAVQELLQLSERNPNGLPCLDPISDLKIRDIDQVETFTKLQSLEEIFTNFKCIHDPNFLDNFENIKKHMILKAELTNYEFLLSEESLKLIPEYLEMIAVLQDLFYIDKSKIVQLKGRVACEISNHELIITEIVFQNKLTGLQPTEIAALLSCCVFQQRNCSAPNLCPALEKAKTDWLEVASKLNMEDEFNFGLMEVTFEWARGMPFAEITELTDVQEGIIVRCITRLDEVIKDVRNAAVVIGDPVLKSKMEEASALIKRDIVFAASLYTQ